MTNRRSFLIPCVLVATLVVTALVPATATRAGSNQRVGGAGTGTTGGRTGGPVVAPGSTTASGTRGRSGRPPSERSPVAASLAAANDRIKRINKAVAALDKAAMKTMPKNLSTGEQQQWTDLGSWIISTKSRYAAHAQALTKATQTTGDPMDLLGAISELDEPFMTLLVAVQDESAKFTNLGKSARSRYDAAMSAIKGIK